MSKNNSPSSLVILGTGIKFISHLTTEAKAYIQKSEKVLYLVNEPAIEQWIQKNSIQAESLHEIYTQSPLRIQCYRAITKYIIDMLHKNQNVCVVLYGHPTVFAKPMLDAAIQAKNEGYDTRILPGISSEDCLFADLMIDPGSHGCQSFEATDFLVRKKKFDTTSHLILWQTGIIGALNHPKSHDNQIGLQLLLNHLSLYYTPNHQLTLYEAAQYPHIQPKIIIFSLRDILKIPFSPISTLYIPPVENREIQLDVLEALGINYNDLL